MPRLGAVHRLPPSAGRSDARLPAGHRRCQGQQFSKSLGPSVSQTKAARSTRALSEGCWQPPQWPGCANEGNIIGAEQYDCAEKTASRLLSRSKKELIAIDAKHVTFSGVPSMRMLPSVHPHGATKLLKEGGNENKMDSKWTLRSRILFNPTQAKTYSSKTLFT